MTPCSVSKPASHSFPSLRPVSVSLAFLVPLRVLFGSPVVQHSSQHPSTIKGVSLLGRELQQLRGGAGGRPAKAGRWGAADAAAAAARCGPGRTLPFPAPRNTPISAAGCQPWRDIAVHHNLPSGASSPVADNLPAVHACALSQRLGPGWRWVDLHGSYLWTLRERCRGPAGARVGCHQVMCLGKAWHHRGCWCDAQGRDPGGIAAASRTEWRTGSFVPQSCFLMG